MDEDGLTLLKSEMTNEEIHVKVNAIHRLKTVIYSIGTPRVQSELIPYIQSKSAQLSPIIANVV